MERIMETVAYGLESEEGTAVRLPASPLHKTLDFLDACREEPAVARDMLLLTPAFQEPSFRLRSIELIEIYEAARRRQVDSGAALRRIEKRRSVPVYRDFLVLLACRKAVFRLSHDPSVRGDALETVFRIEKEIASHLDRIDRALFRVRFASRLGMDLLDDETWEESQRGR